MQRSSHYAHDHLAAKLVVYVGYVLIGLVSIETGNPYVALILGTALWLFGINTVAYCVESLFGHEHQHRIW